MRILLAIDGSASSTSACTVVDSMRWPSGSIIEVVAALEPIAEVFGPTPATLPAPSRPNGATAAIETALAAAVARLERPDRSVRPFLVEGRAANTIVDAATAFRAELIVVGSRGLGPLRSMVLGSVSAEVVDHAPCPVLVVRRPSVGPILLAVDGSAASEAAVTFVRGARFLAGHPVEVMTVAPLPATPPPVEMAGISAAAFDTDRRAIDQSRKHAETIAAAACGRLRGDGVRARWSISQGTPAHEIIEAAASFGSDLIVLGSRGHTGLARIVLGSVARNVLLHTDASVLIVHEPVREQVMERARVRRSAARAMPAAVPG
jgi:nucleotide-binding universal stress UspA family protein